MVLCLIPNCLQNGSCKWKINLSDTTSTCVHFDFKKANPENVKKSLYVDIQSRLGGDNPSCFAGVSFLQREGTLKNARAFLPFKNLSASIQWEDTQEVYNSLTRGAIVDGNRQISVQVLVT